MIMKRLKFLLESIKTIVLRGFLLILYSPVYYLIINLRYLFKKKKQFKYSVSICLIFKDEAHYLKEWLDYHLLIGVDHFYLYNNFSSDNYREVLDPYISKGLVTLIDFPYEYAQVRAYEDCYEKFRAETEWLGFIDADEFVNLISCNSIKEFLGNYKKYPGVYFNWLMFGTSGHIKEDYNQLLIERFTQCWSKLSPKGKTFINNNFNSHIISVHYHFVKYLNLPILSVGVNKFITYKMQNLSKININSKAYLNHYWCKSLEFFIYKNRIKADVASSQYEMIKKSDRWLDSVELKAKSKDFSIQRWLIYLKNTLDMDNEL